MDVPSNIAELEKQLDPTAQVILGFFKEALQKLEQRLVELQAQNDELKRMLFGQRSEKMPPIRTEIRRTIEAEEFAAAVAAREAECAGSGEQSGQACVPPADDAERKTARRKRARAASEPQRKIRRTLRCNLPVITEHISVSPDQLPEGYTLEDLRSLGEGEIVRRVDHVREHLVIVQYVLQKLASRDGLHVVTAPTPAGVAEGGHFGPGLYAHVVTAKCADTMPLYRIAKSLERAGFGIARSTLCSLFHRSAELLEPVYEKIVERIVADPYLNMDETPQPVLDEGKCRRGWIWTLLSAQGIGYRFSPSRAGETATTLLDQTKGWLQTDAFSGYDEATSKTTERQSVGCWAHARRYYFKALTSSPEAKEMLDLILMLYRVEYRAAEAGILGTKPHLLLRQDASCPVLSQIKSWMDEHQPTTPPKSPLGKAIGYMRNQWKPLNRFLEDPRLRLDNNLAENALRIFALGRKNFLFVGHDEAGQNLAILQTIVATCQLHGVNPYDYLRDALIRTSDPKTKLDDLLPWNWKPAPAS